MKYIIDIPNEMVIKSALNGLTLGIAMIETSTQKQFIIPTNISLMPYIEPQKWIPVSERLPDIKEHHVSEPCIVYCENGVYGFAELEENIFGQVGWDCEREDEFHESLGKVLAWMPVPKPYQEDKDGK